MRMSALGAACIYVYYVCVQFLQRPGIVKSPGATVTDRYEPWYGCWELNQGSLQELAVSTLTCSAFSLASTVNFNVLF